MLDTATRSYHITQANTGKTDAYGFSSELSLNAAGWWECNLEGSLYMRKFRSDFYGTAASYSTFSLYLGTDNTFILNKSKTLIAQLNMRFNGPQQHGFDSRQA